MARKSTFKRLTKLEKGLPKAGVKFLQESGYTRRGPVMDAWIKGDFKNPENFVMVFVNENDGFDILYKDNDGEFAVENQPNLYQTFLTHKQLRFSL